MMSAWVFGCRVRRAAMASIDARTAPGCRSTCVTVKASALEMADPTPDRLGIQIDAPLEVADDLVEDVRRPVRPEQASGRHRREKVGDFDPVQHVGVEHDDEPCHLVCLRVVEPEFLGLDGHRSESVGRPGVHAVPVGEHVGQAQPAVGADLVAGDRAGVDLLDQERPAHVEQIGGFYGREFGMDGDHRQPVAGPQLFDNRQQQIMDPFGQLDRGPIGADQPRRLTDPRGYRLKDALEAFQVLVPHSPGPHLDHVAREHHPSNKRNKCSVDFTSRARSSSFGFLRRLRGDANQLEVRRILKAFVGGQWLAGFEQALDNYLAEMSGQVDV